jgi:beta-lactamase class A
VSRPDDEIDLALHVVRLVDGADVGERADEPWVMASVVKVAIGLELSLQEAEGRIDPSRPVTIDPRQATPGPVGISRFRHPVTMSLRDVAYLMLTISDNAATDVVTAAVGLDAVTARLQAIGCDTTHVVSDIATMLDGVATDLGFPDYAELLRAQSGERGPEAQARATDQRRIDACRALDPTVATRTTARDMTRLLTAIWADEASAPLRAAMAEQVTRRMAPAVPDGGTLAAKSGGLFGRIRNEVGVITDPGRDGTAYAFAVLTRAHRPFAGEAAANAAMAAAVANAITRLRPPKA